MTTLPKSRTILVVEHDEVTTETYAHSLRVEGYQVRTALSADAGLRDVAVHPPHAILVDFRMPGMNGLEFVRQLRAREHGRTIPVAIVTGDYLLPDTIDVQLKALGAEVLFKPLWLDDLATFVHKLVTPV
jgi:two-component system response regulator AtoC